jgi:hypothetical protein
VIFIKLVRLLGAGLAAGLFVESSVIEKQDKTGGEDKS